MTKELSIKAIVHYGELTVYDIDRLAKLFGKTLVDAHRLLKNSIGMDTYVLIASQYLQALGISTVDVNDSCENYNCELYDVGDLCYSFFPFDDLSINNAHKTLGRKIPILN